MQIDIANQGLKTILCVGHTEPVEVLGASHTLRQARADDTRFETIQSGFSLIIKLELQHFGSLQ